MAKAPRSFSDTLDLPVVPLAAVLQLVSERHRLSSCALVNQNWRQAANLATTNIIIGRDIDLWCGVNSLSAWLNNNIYASEITNIQVDPKDDSRARAIPELQLPCSKLGHLRSLKLPRCHLILSATAASASVASTSASSVRPLAALRALSRLELDSTILDLSGLGSFTGLQHLSLDHVKHLFDSDLSGSATVRASQASSVVPITTWAPQLAAALPQLTQLTHLTFAYSYDRHLDQHHVPAISQNAANLSSLQQLRELHLYMDKLAGVELNSLPTCLTRLLMDEPPVLTRMTTPGLMDLAKLQHLHIHGGLTCDPLILSTLTSLTWLSLESLDSSGIAVNLEDSPADYLLMALQLLTRLQHLEISESLMHEPTDVEMYSALLASTQLTSLILKRCAWAAEAALYVFLADETPRSLRNLTADADLLGSIGSFEALAACCPNLEKLEIPEEFEGPEEAVNEQHVIDLQSLFALSRLTALTKLDFRNVDVSEDALQDIAACTQLKELVLWANCSSETLKAYDVRQLTQLTGLERIELKAITPEDISFDNTAPADTASNVHEQLNEAIDDQYDPFEDTDNSDIVQGLPWATNDGDGNEPDQGADQSDGDDDH